MSERDNSTFRMIPPLQETVQMTFYRLVRLKNENIEEHEEGLKIVLRTVLSEKDQKEYLLDVPKGMEREVEVAIKRFIAQRINVKSLIEDLVDVSHVMLRGIVIWQSMIDDSLMADAYTLSMDGDESNFSIDNPISAILFALLKGRPIYLEKQLLNDQPVIRRMPNDANEMSFLDRYVDYSDQIVEKHIRSSLGTQLYRDGELEETFRLMGRKRLAELRDLAVSLESFEWAKRIEDFLSKSEANEKDGDEASETVTD